MTLDELRQLITGGQANFLKEPQSQKQKETVNPLLDFLQVLEALRKPRVHLTAAPAFTPKNLVEQIQFYDDGVNRRIYFYINNAWRYATLT